MALVLFFKEIYMHFPWRCMHAPERVRRPMCSSRPQVLSFKPLLNSIEQKVHKKSTEHQAPVLDMSETYLGLQPMLRYELCHCQLIRVFSGLTLKGLMILTRYYFSLHYCTLWPQQHHESYSLICCSGDGQFARCTLLLLAIFNVCRMKL